MKVICDVEISMYNMMYWYRFEAKSRRREHPVPVCSRQKKNGKSTRVVQLRSGSTEDNIELSFRSIKQNGCECRELWVLTS